MIVHLKPIGKPTGIVIVVADALVKLRIRPLSPPDEPNV